MPELRRLRALGLAFGELVAVSEGLIEQGVFLADEIRDMLDRLETIVRRVEAEVEGDLAEEAKVVATGAIVDHLRDILFSDGTSAGPSSWSERAGAADGRASLVR